LIDERNPPIDRLNPVATWSDIALSDTDQDLLRQVVEEVRREPHPIGVTALFAGESRTAKIQAAEVLATHLRRTLYHIDLGAVVSKYAGETEKNLGRIFDAVAGSGAILYFDQADALFGGRSDVRDSHDRYASSDIDGLLQRLESHDGLTILATNMKSNLDPAFTLRMRFVITFPPPGGPPDEAA
jgi:SpoVK/Ycf46/Vps4 family AAA+-type ATPase